MQTEEIQLASRKHGLVHAGLSVAVVSLGVYLSHIRFLDNEWVSRAGCLVVAIGIWSGLGGIIREKVITGRLRVRHRMAALRLRRTLRRGGADEARIAAEMDGLNDDAEAQIKAVSDQLRLSVGMLEVALLITGTLLWGFGDLLTLNR